MAAKQHDAPNLDSLSMLDAEGHRRYVLPADARGRYSRAKPWVYGLLIALYVGLPFASVGGHPAVLLDIPARQAWLFGQSFNAQDFYLVFFILTGIGFGLIVMSALFGRIWCGWACPQTVFLDGVFRRIERWIEGPAPRRARLADAPWSFEKLWRKGLKHAIYVALAVAIAQVFIAYFISADGVARLWAEGPAEHPAAFIWAVAMSGILYFNFWWFREQLCIVICPYGRLQSALQDQHTLIIGYDTVRGEPRGKLNTPGAGDCVACNRCVAVCPTGIDIRHGLQLECIGCAYCIDACDEIMVKVGRPKGLIRYDSQAGLSGETRRFWRPRVFAYVLAGLLGLAVATFMFRTHKPFEANVTRVQGAPFVVQDGLVENRLLVHVVNKNPKPSLFQLEPVREGDPRLMIPQAELLLQPFQDHRFPVVVEVPTQEMTPGLTVGLRVIDPVSQTSRVLDLEILGPRRAEPGATP
ncbi:MAG: cytochrome c oxidase accessory protein CcoG [Deltaproteobacteria bacterium]|nr:cytochrome c oxidase accessory protein CcoG [Deltaproteobacteria bacterium]MCB9786423.1 cytochrome c oxidase accessory protein CcoG [Deltaproteobacteria bacterium]